MTCLIITNKKKTYDLICPEIKVPINPVKYGKGVVPDTNALRVRVYRNEVEFRRVRACQHKHIFFIRSIIFWVVIEFWKRRLLSILGEGVQTNLDLLTSNGYAQIYHEYKLLIIICQISVIIWRLWKLALKIDSICYLYNAIVCLHTI